MRCGERTETRHIIELHIYNITWSAETMMCAHTFCCRRPANRKRGGGGCGAGGHAYWSCHIIKDHVIDSLHVNIYSPADWWRTDINIYVWLYITAGITVRPPSFTMCGGGLSDLHFWLIKYSPPQSVDQYWACTNLSYLWSQKLTFKPAIVSVTLIGSCIPSW